MIYGFAIPCKRLSRVLFIDAGERYGAGRFLHSKDNLMRHLLIALTTIAVLSGCSKAPPPSPEAEKAVPVEPKVEELRLYVLDCGRVFVSDMSIFDKGGAYDGQSRTMTAPCYLIRHKSGDLLWDSGLSDAIHDAPDGIVSEPFTLMVPKTLEGQLERLGVPPEYIEYFAISHSHFDHLGNANLFKSSTFIVSEKEKEYMFRPEARADTQAFANYSELEAAKKATYTDSYDVFGDGKVIIISMPGHTPGHSVLLVNLAHSGPILLSGDLYHLIPARQNRTVPSFNTSTEETLASMDKFEELARTSDARVIIQHELEDFENLPRAPAYLD